jgi:signal transduction histidine kinase
MTRPSALKARFLSVERRSRRTARVRLALLFGTMFLVCGAALLAVTYTLVSHGITGGEGVVDPPPPALPRRFVDPSAPGYKLLPAPTLRMPQVPASVIRVLESSAGQEFMRLAETQQRVTELHQLEIESAIALGIMAVLAALLGWVAAGRVLRPLRTITATTREISATSLDKRLALQGPADELKDLGDTIDALLARLEDSFTAQRAFVANASHELRTPLTLSQVMLQFALADPEITLADLKATCREVLDAGSDHEQLIEALLTLAYSQQGIEHREPINLAEIVHELLGAARPPTTAGGITIDTELSPAWVSGDPRLIRQLVNNLTENALRHNISGGTVRVTVQTRARHTLLTVDNTGTAVPADQIDRLLQPFQRLKPDRTDDTAGHGLGLSIIRAIATAHDATIQIQPNLAGGLRISIAFPALTAPKPRRPAARQLDRLRHG